MYPWKHHLLLSNKEMMEWICKCQNKWEKKPWSAYRNAFMKWTFFLNSKLLEQHFLHISEHICIFSTTPQKTLHYPMLFTETKKQTENSIGWIATNWLCPRNTPRMLITYLDSQVPFTSIESSLYRKFLATRQDLQAHSML